MGKKKKGENKNCKACGKEFYVPEYRINIAKFCSLFCQNHKQYEKFKFTCKQCGKLSESSPSRKGKKIFCSCKCMADFEIDRKSCQKQKRNLHIYEARKKGIIGNSGTAVRKYAIAMKEKKCELCGFDEFECCLDVHHVDKNPNNNSLENLAILCVMCHRKVHRKIINL